MSTVIATSVLPDSTANDTLTFGATGDSVVISGDSLNLNTLQDAGGNTVFVSDGSGTITSQGLPGAMILISTQTASGAASIEFKSNIDSTYDVYIFKFININPATDKTFQMQASTDGGTTYGVTQTNTFWESIHTEAGSGSAAYRTDYDQAQTTVFFSIGPDVGSAADENLCGELHLFAPSSTTYVKHYYVRNQEYFYTDASLETYVAGYFNTTSAIDAVKFQPASGNFDATIALYGISKS